MAAYSALIHHQHRLPAKTNNRHAETFFTSPETQPGALKNQSWKQAFYKNWGQSFARGMTDTESRANIDRSGLRIVGLDPAAGTVLQDATLLKLSAKGIWQKRRILLTQDNLYVATERPPRHKEGFVNRIALSSSNADAALCESVYLVLEHGCISYWCSEADYRQKNAPIDESLPVVECQVRLSGFMPGMLIGYPRMLTCLCTIECRRT